MKAIPTEKEIVEIVSTIETDLLSKPKLDFSTDSKWKEHFPKESGVYAVFENSKLIYIGETSELRARMGDLRRTYNHTLRNKLGVLRLKSEREGNKFSDEVENKLDAYMEKNISITFHALSFGRIEVESRLVQKHKNKLLNSVSLRGVKK